ncbi:hypothetical protein BDW62DRAFT_213836 [Aspergillus aurantiobrunneus]
MACPKSLECNKSKLFEIDPNPDVIIISFIASAWCTLIVILLTFNFSNSFPSDKKNDFDHDMIRCARKLGKYTGQSLNSFKRRIPSRTVQRITLTLGDQQLITGASIFIAVYGNLCDISQYHFKVAYYLGAASFLTHQSTVMMVRDFLEPSPLMRAWRMLWVLAIFAFVFSNNLVIYSSDFSEAQGLTVQCVFLLTFTGTYDLDSVFLTLTSIFWGWGLFALILSGQALYFWALEKEKAAQPQGGPHYIFTQLLCSTVIDLFRILTSLTATTFGIYRIKNIDSGLQEDDAWNFGQIMSVILLALPLFQALELLYDGWCTPVRNADIVLSSSSSTEQGHFYYVRTSLLFSTHRD